MKKKACTVVCKSRLKKRWPVTGLAWMAGDRLGQLNIREINNVKIQRKL